MSGKRLGELTLKQVTQWRLQLLVGSKQTQEAPLTSEYVWPAIPSLPLSCQFQYEILEHTGGGYQPKTFYGRLEHIYTVTFQRGCQGLQIFHPTTYILACIRQCRIRKEDPQLTRLDIHLYKERDEIRLDVTDITSVQCLVGRVRDGSDGWAIIDRSGTLARAVYLGDESSGG